jgi:uncharacterized protein YlxW (UPF0749 family)
MRRSFGSLIIFRPASSQILRLHYTRRAVRLMITVAVIAVFAMLFGRRMVRLPVPETERARLATENQKLKTENMNLEIEAQRLQSRILDLEEKSKRMSEIAGAD